MKKLLSKLVLGVGVLGATLFGFGATTDIASADAIQTNPIQSAAVYSDMRGDVAGYIDPSMSVTVECYLDNFNSDMVHINTGSFEGNVYVQDPYNYSETNVFSYNPDSFAAILPWCSSYLVK